MSLSPAFTCVYTRAGIVIRILNDGVAATTCKNTVTVLLQASVQTSGGSVQCSLISVPMFQSARILRTRIVEPIQEMLQQQQ
jgi:hypothetical protein